eukprot:2575887-Lingulodinium_polyedra.AAC.1
MDVSEALRLALERCAAWNIPIVAVALDVRKAFDSMDHAMFLEAVRAHDLQPEHTIALLRSLLGQEMRVEVAGVAAPGVPLRRGGRQGGRSTPLQWNLYLDSAFGEVFETLGAE